jgi:hypothetical protein
MTRPVHDQVLMRSVGAALILGWASACSSPCDLVLGCAASPRVAVEGRVLATTDGHVIPSATVRVLAEYDTSVDSAESTTDSRGLFSLSIPASGSQTPRIALRVIPPGRPGYRVLLDDCKPVVQWGDACVLDPVVNEPTLPLLVLLDGDSNPVPSGTSVVFKRTGGAALMTRIGEGTSALDSVGSVTGGEGFVNLFPLEVWAGSNDAILGDLIVDLPSPVGRVVRHGYAVTPAVFYGLRIVTREQVGPSAGAPIR